MYKIIFYLTREEQKNFICTSTDADVEGCIFYIRDDLILEDIKADLAKESDIDKVVVDEALIDKSGLAPADESLNDPVHGCNWVTMSFRSAYVLGRKIEEYLEDKYICYEELERYIYYHSIIQISQYPDLLEKFMPSQEMVEFLKTPIKSADHMADIIYHSPKSFEEKLAGLKELSHRLEGSAEIVYKKECDELIANMEQALKYINSEGVFTVEPSCHDEKKHDSSSYFEGVFANWEQVIKYIQDDMKVNEITDESLWWYEVTKWILEDGKYVDACTYFVVRGELWYAHLKDPKDFYCDPGFYSGIELNLPVPFKAGDIVEYDGYPFTPKQEILICTVGDNLDCCCLESLHWDYDGKCYKLGAVKHGFLGMNMYPGVSVLYTMQTSDNGNDLFKLVHKCIGESEELGARLLDAVDECSEEDIKKILADIKGSK